MKFSMFGERFINNTGIKDLVDVITSYSIHYTKLYDVMNVIIEQIITYLL